MMTKEGYIKIINFMTPGPGALMLGRGHISHIVNMYYLYSTLIAIVLRDDAAFPTMVDFFCDGTIDKQI